MEGPLYFSAHLIPIAAVRRSRLVQVNSLPHRTSSLANAVNCGAFHGVRNGDDGGDVSMRAVWTDYLKVPAWAAAPRRPRPS